MNITVNKPGISDEAAQAMIVSAVNAARRLQVAQVVALLDESGLLKAFCRMDGAPLVSIEVAQNKAYTALFGLPSGDLFDAIKADAALSAALPHVSRFTMVGGGLPIRIEGQIVGAVGVGGGTVEQDIACARAALESLSASE